jgi:hypothetical protein
VDRRLRGGERAAIRAGATPEVMRQVAQHLAKERSIVGVCASAIVVRLISYIMLQRKQQQQRQIDQAGAPAGRQS